MVSEQRGLTPDETFAALYRLALDVAEERGAQITAAARGSGAYAFMAEARRLYPDVKIMWDGGPAPS
ncbi:hypothetical protein [Streptomyces sp. NPDC088757]|uniref:hypothetical protein n=1 Tax=Streptomyces sp. NPDC088757 TaxID=3365889 RepID=UPI00381BD2FD